MHTGMPVEKKRFDGKPTVKVAISDVVKKSNKIIEKIEEAFKNR